MILQVIKLEKPCFIYPTVVVVKSLKIEVPWQEHGRCGSKDNIDSKIAKAFTGIQTQPEPEPWEDEEQPEVPPVVIPKQPETDPATQPTPESEPYVRLCQLSGREEAWKKLVIYVCSPHAEVGRPDMRKLLADLKAKVDKENQFWGRSHNDRMISLTGQCLQTGKRNRRSKREKKRRINSYL